MSRTICPATNSAHRNTTTTTTATATASSSKRHWEPRKVRKWKAYKPGSVSSWRRKWQNSHPCREQESEQVTSTSEPAPGRTGILSCTDAALGSSTNILAHWQEDNAEERAQCDPDNMPLRRESQEEEQEEQEQRARTRTRTRITITTRWRTTRGRDTQTSITNTVCLRVRVK